MLTAAFVPCCPMRHQGHLRGYARKIPKTKPLLLLSMETGKLAPATTIFCRYRTFPHETR